MKPCDCYLQSRVTFKEVQVTGLKLVVELLVQSSFLMHLLVFNQLFDLNLKIQLHSG